MNKKVWRKDKKLMIIVNSTASKILTLADGKKPFNDLSKEVFLGDLDIGQLNLEIIETANIAAELADHFLHSAMFCVGMWEKGLLKLVLSSGDQSKLVVSSLLQSVIDDSNEISIVKTLEKLSVQGSGPAEVYSEFNQLRTNLAMLLAYDMVLPSFAGAIEEYDETDVVSEGYLPQYRIGYLQPGLIVTKPTEWAQGLAAIAPAYGAIVGVTVVSTTFADSLGYSIGLTD